MKKFIISEEERKSILNQHLNLKHILQEKAGKKNNIILEYNEPITDVDFFKQAEQYFIKAISFYRFSSCIPNK